MSEEDEDQIETDDAPAKRSKLPLILGFLALCLGGGGGFYAAWSGMILAPESDASKIEAKVAQPPSSDVVFIPMEQIVVSLSPGSTSKHLVFRAQLEVPKENQENVEHLMPRIIDVLNGYLRAIETRDIEAPAALLRLRAQMLRRIQIVAGRDQVNDLLVMEFVLN